jgi:GDP-4-dehydro-6-deoxy-D-mannose reductase
MTAGATGEASWRILVTGASGFVGRTLLAAIGRSSLSVARTVAGLLSREEARFPHQETIDLDIGDPGSVDRAVREVRPTHLVHLAAVSAVPEASGNPELTWRVNFLGCLHLMEAVRRHAPTCHILHVSSAEVYGASFRSAGSLDESAPSAPVNIYAASKAAADALMGQAAKQGLSVLRFRPFNHTGPGQSERFAVPAFAAQIARIERGLQAPVVCVGALDTARDFLDVRDVAQAYLAAIRRAGSLPNGTAVNLASGQARRIGDVLRDLCAMSRVPVSIETDAARLRPADVPVMSGDARLARRILDWTPKIAWDVTLADVLDDWRERVGVASM